MENIPVFFRKIAVADFFLQVRQLLRIYFNGRGRLHLPGPPNLNVFSLFMGGQIADIASKGKQKMTPKLFQAEILRHMGVTPELQGLPFHIRVESSWASMALIFPASLFGHH